MQKVTRLVIMNKKVGIIDYVGLKGGNHYYSLCLLDALADLGYETYLLSNLTKGLNEEKIHIQKTFDFDISRNLTGFSNLIGGTIKACRILKKNRVKTVIFHLFEASWIPLVVLSIFKFYGLKVIGISHDVTSFEKNENQKARDFIYSKLIDQVIVHNLYSYNYLKQVLQSQILAKTMIIKHGGHKAVINSNIDQKTARKTLGLDENKTYALFFGQIKKVKGLDLLLEAFPTDIENLHLIIAGKPWKDEFQIYESIIESRRLTSKTKLFIKYISEEERDNLYNAADFIVLPYREIFQSGVLLMAMSYGLPIIASDLPANKEVLNNNEGLLFKSENIENLNTQIKKMASDKVLRESYAKDSIIKIESEYAWSTIAKEYVSIIQ